MNILRPALLVLLTTALAGLGVPRSFGHAKTASSSKSAASRNTQGKTAPQETTPSHNTTSPQKASPQKNASANGQTKSSAVKGASAKSTGKAATNSRKSSARSSATKRTRKQPGQKAPTNERISEIQTALAKDGSFQGLPSGKWDDDTAAAMRRFQAAHGLTANGKLDAPSLQRLGLGSQTAGVAAPTPPPGATSRLTSSNNSPSNTDVAPRRNQ